VIQLASAAIFHGIESRLFRLVYLIARRNPSIPKSAPPPLLHLQPTTTAIIYHQSK
jgi:hypothetical protein